MLSFFEWKEKLKFLLQEEKRLTKERDQVFHFDVTRREELFTKKEKREHYLLHEKDERDFRIWRDKMFRSVEEVVKICNVHWTQLESVSGVLTTCQPPEDVAIKRGTLEEVIDEAEKAWGSTGEVGATRTPALLDTLAHHTQGGSIVANLALLCNNASIAGEIAVAMGNVS